MITSQHVTITTPLLHNALLHITTALLCHYSCITSPLLHLCLVLLHITLCPLFDFITAPLLLLTTKCHYFEIGLTTNYYVLLPYQMAYLPLIRITFLGNLQMYSVF
jgi:hypothetical protein